MIYKKIFCIPIYYSYLSVQNVKLYVKIMFLENKLIALQHIFWSPACDICKHPQWTVENGSKVYYNKNLIN